MDGDGERSSARQNNLVVSVEVVNAGGPQNQKFFGAVMVEIVAQGRNGAVGETVAVVESGGSGGAELGAALETNGVELGGEKIVEVGATAEKDVVGAEEGVTAVGQMQGDRLYCHQVSSFSLLILVDLSLYTRSKEVRAKEASHRLTLFCSVTWLKKSRRPEAPTLVLSPCVGGLPGDPSSSKPD
jgi:hypothetical protein